MRGKSTSQAAAIPAGEQSLLTTKAQAARRRAAFTVLEIMVAVALLAVIIVGLLAMFYQVQRAFRAGTAQVDVMENGRAAISMITREMHEVEAVGLLGVTNLVIVPSDPPTRTPTSQTLSSGDVQNNILRDFCFLQRRNDEWTGVAYRLSNAISGVGTLVRYSWSWARETNPIWADDTNAVMSGLICRQPSNPLVIDHSQVLDGVVHFQVEAYDDKGVLCRDYPNPLPNDAYLRFDNANDVFAFMSTNLPAYLDLELRVLEPATLARFRVREQADLINGTTTRLEYLGRQIGRTHVFRQRIPVRSAATTAF